MSVPSSSGFELAQRGAKGAIGAAAEAATAAARNACDASLPSSLLVPPFAAPSSLPSCLAGTAVAEATAASTVAGIGAAGAARARPTLASTAKLFLPSDASPFLLAPSEHEIHADAQWYSFGAQLVAALLILTCAWMAAYVILGFVRRREARARQQLRAIVKQQQEQAQRQRQLQRQQHQILYSNGDGAMVRPRLYKVQPAAVASSSLFSPSPSPPPPLPSTEQHPYFWDSSRITLELSDDFASAASSASSLGGGLLARLRRRLRHTIEWMRSWPARWRKRRRARQRALQRELQNIMHRSGALMLRRASVSERGVGGGEDHRSNSSSHAARHPQRSGPSSDSSSSGTKTPTAATALVSQARRMSTSIVNFLGRSSPRFGPSSSAETAGASGPSVSSSRTASSSSKRAKLRRRHHTSSRTSSDFGGGMTGADNAVEEDASTVREKAMLVAQQLLESFSAAPASWLLGRAELEAECVPPVSDAAAAAAAAAAATTEASPGQQQQQGKRRMSFTSWIINTGSSLGSSGGNDKAASPVPSSDRDPSPLSLDWSAAASPLSLPSLTPQSAGGGSRSAMSSPARSGRAGGNGALPELRLPSSAVSPSSHAAATGAAASASSFVASTSEPGVPASRPLSPESMDSSSRYSSAILGSAAAVAASAGSGGSSDDALILASFPEEENAREFLTYSLSTFVLCVALVWLQLLVLSVLASASSTVALYGLAGIGSGAGSQQWPPVYALNQLYLFSWCSKEWVTLLWSCTTWLSSLSLFVLAPFAFLYFEAEGVWGRRGTLSRLGETLAVLTAFAVSLYGSFHLLQLLLGVVVSAGSSAASAAAPVAAAAAERAPFWAELLGLGWLFRLLNDGFLLSVSTRRWMLLGLLDVESLYTNVWHFLPGSLLLLACAHRGALDIIRFCLARATDGLWGGYSANSISASLIDGRSLYPQQHQFQLQQQLPLLLEELDPSQHEAVLELNAVRCELATLQRKWAEMHDPLLQHPPPPQLQRMQVQHMRPFQLHTDKNRFRSSRAIAPSNPSSSATLLLLGGSGASMSSPLSSSSFSPALSRQAKSLLRARLEEQQARHDALLRQLRPQLRHQDSWQQRLWRSPYLRNSGWALLTLIAMLLTWHIVLRVAQREARLIFRGSIFRWFRSDYYAAASSTFEEPLSQSWWARAGRALWSGLGELKTLLGTLLSVLTGKGLANASAAAAAAAASSVPPSPPSAPFLPIGVESAVAASSLSSFFSTLLDMLRLLLSVLGGINGFQHPLVAFLADLAVLAFFLLAVSRALFDAQWLRKMNPLRAVKDAIMEAKRNNNSIHTGQQKDHPAAPSATVVATAAGSPSTAADPSAMLTATDASSSVGTGTTPAPADSSSLLFSAQFFTVNAALFLLIASSLPIATWMLGLSSFDLETFYPPAAAQLLPPPSGPPFSTSQRSSSSNSGGSLLLHLYNLTFLALTFWHATQISSAIVLWVLVDQLLARLERAVHRARVALGWARADQPAFMLFRSWRTASTDAADALPRTRTQKVLRVLSALWRTTHWLLSPLARAVWFVLVRLWRLSCLLFWHAWDALTLFLMQELSDEPPPAALASATAKTTTSKQQPQQPSSTAAPVSLGSPDEVTAQSPSAAATNAVSGSAEAAASGAAASIESGSLTSQLLAEVDAASQQVAAAAAAATLPFAGTEIALALPTAPGPESPSSRRALSSMIMSPLLSEEEQQRADVDAETAAATGFFTRSLSAPPHLHVNATAATDDASVNAAVAADVAASMDASVAAAVSLEAAVTPLHSAQPHHLPQRSLDFSPLFRSQTAARSLALGTHSLLATPVPGLSRLLSGDVRSSPSVVSGTGVSELDFPVIPAGAADSPIDEEDDDESVASSAMSSAASSAVGTPQRSPLYSPMQLSTPFAQHAAARGATRHRLHRSFDVPPLELSASLFDATSTGSASVSVNGDNGSDYSVSPWTPSSSGSARSASASSVRDDTGDASHASPAHATTIASSASSVRERLALAASAGGGAGGAVWLRRLEPMAEEEEERVDGDVDVSGGHHAASSSPAFVAASSALVDAPSSLHSSRSQSASSASSSESTGSNDSGATADATDALVPPQSTPPLRTRTRTRSSSSNSNSNSPQPCRAAGGKEDNEDPRVKLSGSQSTSESASDAEEGEM